jgi:4-hydroxymandelate oxidase
MGGMGTGASVQKNIQALARLKFNLRAIHGAENPATKFGFFGRFLSVLVMVSPLSNSHLNGGGGLSEADLAESLAFGAHQVGSLVWIGIQ